jgi:hypothetical protein
MEGGLRRRLCRAPPRQGESRFKRAAANLFYRLMGRLGDVSHPAMPAISTWSIARRSDGRATASGDIELAGGDRSRRWPGGFERMGAGGRPVHARSHCHRARFALYPREARPDGPVAQRLEPAAHNGLVAGSSPARPTTPSFRPLSFNALGPILPNRAFGWVILVFTFRPPPTAASPRSLAGLGWPCACKPAPPRSMYGRGCS